MHPTTTTFQNVAVKFFSFGLYCYVAIMTKSPNSQFLPGEQKLPIMISIVYLVVHIIREKFDRQAEFELNSEVSIVIWDVNTTDIDGK